MKPILIGALILGGGYFLLKDNIAQFMHGGPAAPPAATPDPATPPAVTPDPAAMAKKFFAAVQAKLPAGMFTTLQSADTWNWFAIQAYPTYVPPAPEAIFPGGNAHAPVSIQQWYTGITPLLPATGLSGAMQAADAAPAGMIKRRGRQAWS